MDSNLPPETLKPPTQVLAEYERAGSTERWLRFEVGDFFSGATGETTMEECLDLADSVLEANSESYMSWMSGEFRSDDLTVMDLVITNVAAQESSITAYRELPSPVSLLWLCSQVCDVGNQVAVTHRLARGTEYTITSVWPFGMQVAATMTTPDPDGLAESLTEWSGSSRESSGIAHSVGSSGRPIAADAEELLFHATRVGVLIGAVLGVASTALLVDARRRLRRR